MKNPGMRPLPALVVLLLIMAPACFASAQDSRNAATWYQRAAERLDDLTWAEKEVIWKFQDDVSAEPSPELRNVLAKITPMLEDFRRASRQEWVDFDGIHIGPPDMPSMHLSRIRSISFLMRVDALVRLHDGDSAGAADRIASTYRACEHLAGDRSLIGSLCGEAMFLMSEGMADVGFGQAAFNPYDAGLMLRAVEDLNSADPFDLLENLPREQEESVAWLNATDRHDSEQWMEAMKGHMPGEEHVSCLTMMTDEEYDESIAQYDLVMDEIVTAFAMPDRQAARAELERIEKEVRDGEHGVLAEGLAKYHVRVFEIHEDCKQKMSDRIAMLRGIAGGEINPEDEANAAVYYARGTEKMRQIEPERFDAVCSFQKEGSEQKADESLIEILVNAGPIVDLFREGSEKRRCDFAFLRPGVKWRQFCPEYVAGMRDAVRLLHADAIRLIQSGDAEGAADRLVICYRVVAHLTGDEPILSALLAHRVLERTQELAVGALEAEVFSQEHRKELLKAARQISRKDPFGYINSIMVARRAISLRVPDAEDELDRRRVEAAREMIDHLSGDQLIHYLAIIDALARAGEEKANPDGPRPADPVRRLGDVVSLDELEAVRDQAQVAGPILAAGGIDIFQGRQIPLFGLVVERQRASRACLRRVLAELKERPSLLLAEPPGG